MSQEPMTDKQFMDMIDKLQNIVESLLEPNSEPDESPDFNLDQSVEPDIKVTRNIQRECLENAESSSAWETKLSPEERRGLIFVSDLDVVLEQSIYSSLQACGLSASEPEESLNFDLLRSTGFKQSIFPSLHISTNMEGEYLESSMLEVSALRDGLDFWLNESIT